MVPLWGPNLISFCFISPLENVFWTSIYKRYLLIFDLSIFLSPGGGPLWSPMGSQFDLFLVYCDGGGGIEKVFWTSF